jgi:signal peptidase I
MTPAGRATRLVATISATGLLGLGPPSAGVAPPANECCYQVPSGAMKPTLFPHDKFGLAKYGAGAEPRRGDVAAFKRSKDSPSIYVDRLVGLPGDRLQMIRGTLQINGRPVKRDRIGDFDDEEDGRRTRFRRWRETLPNGVSYETIDLKDDYFLADTPAYDVPPDHYFLMGDNRQNSLDSRSLSSVGYVPADLVMGRVVVQ